MAATDPTTPALEAPPERDCYGCGQRDTHPRVVLARSLDAADDELYHYDCLPKGHANQVDDPAALAGFAATADGLRGGDVQAAVVAAGAPAGIAGSEAAL